MGRNVRQHVRACPARGVLRYLGNNANDTPEGLSPDRPEPATETSEHTRPVRIRALRSAGCTEMLVSIRMLPRWAATCTGTLTCKGAIYTPKQGRTLSPCSPSPTRKRDEPGFLRRVQRRCRQTIGKRNRRSLFPPWEARWCPLRAVWELPVPSLVLPLFAWKQLRNREVALPGIVAEGEHC